MTDPNWREKQMTRIKNILPKEDVVRGIVNSEPHTFSQIKYALMLHGHAELEDHKTLKNLLSRLGVVGIPFMCSPDKPGKKDGWSWRYGLRDRIEEDFDGGSGECTYINPTSWYLRGVLEPSFYRSLEQIQ